KVVTPDGPARCGRFISIARLDRDERLAQRQQTIDARRVTAVRLRSRYAKACSLGPRHEEATMVNHQSAWTVSSPVEHMPRRRFLRATSLLFTSTAIGLILDARLSRVLAAQQVQDDWAHCGDCNMLFFNGFHTDKGRCPAFGVPAKSGHIAEK